MVTIILNPVAGGRRNARLFEQLQRFVQERGVDAEVVKTIAPGDGAHLATVALKRGREHVVAVGGDGTVHEVLNGVLDQGAVLGIVPAGATNSVARALGLPARWEDALPIALAGTPRAVDVALADDRAFLGTAGFGLEVETLGAEPARLPGRRVEAPLVRAVLDGGLTLAAPVIAGSVACAAARASLAIPEDVVPDDGSLVVTLVTDIGRGAPRTRLRCRRMELLEPADVALHLDGEVRRAATPLVFSLAAQRQTILAPRA